MNKIFLLLLTIACLYSDEVQIKADSLYVENKTVKANNNVSLEYAITSLKADKLIYDTNTTEAKLYGNVKLKKDLLFEANSSYVDINLKEDCINMDNVFIYFNDGHVWIKNEKTTTENEKYIIKDASLSSCNPKNPDWKISFSKGVIDKKTNIISLYHPLFYIKDTPVFYFPYFAFSINKTRSSGLLRPKFGYKEDEGFLYLQPYYLALDPSYDLEFTPQFRSIRGQGIYANFRFVDSNRSKGKISTGIFKDNSTYTYNHNLENDSHYGINLMYEKDKIIWGNSTSAHDGLFVDLKYLNDIDYINLEKRDVTTLDKLVTSTINYYGRTDSQYLGTYLKYHIDTAKKSNNDTIQTLPVINYHIFENSLFFDNLLYSFDWKATNYYRSKGVNAFQNELVVPIGFHMSVLENYINFSIMQNSYLSYAKYSSPDVYMGNLDYTAFAKSYTKFSVDTNLAKKFKNIFHTFNLGLDLIIPNYDRFGGCDNEYCNFITYPSDKRSFGVKYDQYFYDNNGSTILTHKFSQDYYLADSKWGSLNNEILYNGGYFSLRNVLKYSHQRNLIENSVLEMNIKTKILELGLLHNYENVINSNKSNYLLATINTNISDNSNIFGNVKYDLEADESTKWEVGITSKRKCWSYKLSYFQEVEPKLSNIGLESTKKNGIGFTIIFEPIGKIKFNKVSYED